jgi:hypothetical protein
MIAKLAGIHILTGRIPIILNVRVRILIRSTIAKGGSKSVIPIRASQKDKNVAKRPRIHQKKKDMRNYSKDIHTVNRKRQKRYDGSGVCMYIDVIYYFDWLVNSYQIMT